MITLARITTLTALALAIALALIISVGRANATDVPIALWGKMRVGGEKCDSCDELNYKWEGDFRKCEIRRDISEEEGNHPLKTAGLTGYVCTPGASPQVFVGAVDPQAAVLRLHVGGHVPQQLLVLAEVRFHRFYESSRSVTNLPADERIHHSRQSDFAR